MCQDMGPVGGGCLGGVLAHADAGCRPWVLWLVDCGCGCVLQLRWIADCGPRLHLRFVGGGVSGLRLAPVCVGCCWDGLSSVFQQLLCCDSL